MDYDFAIVYWGLPRSVKKTYMSHIQRIFNILDSKNLRYKKFMHTWKTATQCVWDTVIDQEIDYNEYTLLTPDFYTIDSQDDFLSTVDMNRFFYKDIFFTKGHSPDGEWLPQLIRNHLCALESQKRSLEMVEEFVKKGNTFNRVIFLRPDVFIEEDFPIYRILLQPYDICIPNCDHYEGYNDRFAITKYEKAAIYGKRINEIADFRKTNGRIVSEKYVKYILTKYSLKLEYINFPFTILRP